MPCSGFLAVFLFVNCYALFIFICGSACSIKDVCFCRDLLYQWPSESGCCFRFHWLPSKTWYVLCSKKNSGYDSQPWLGRPNNNAFCLHVFVVCTYHDIFVCQTFFRRSCLAEAVAWCLQVQCNCGTAEVGCLCFGSNERLFGDKMYYFWLLINSSRILWRVGGVFCHLVDMLFWKHV